MRSSTASGSKTRASACARSWRRAASASAALLAALAGCGADAIVTAPPPADPPPFSVFAAPPDRQDARSRAARWETARLDRPTRLHTAPGGRVVARLRPRTEFDSARVFAVVNRRGAWLEVLATERPNGRTGWILAADATLGGTDWSVHADLSDRQVTLRHGRRVVRRFAVAIGGPATPTPRGRFAVTDKLRPNWPGSPYGCCLLVLSGHQPKLVEGWPGGDRLGIHGTLHEASVGAAVSLGCLRAQRRHMRALMRRVPLGAPVFVRS